jgi:hypothetical protein
MRLAGGKLGARTVGMITADKLTHSQLQTHRSQYRWTQTAPDGEGVTMLRPGDLALATAIELPAASERSIDWCFNDCEFSAGYADGY